MKLFRILAMIGILIPAIATAQGAYFDPRGCDPRTCSESGWIYDDASGAHTTVWRHGLGSTPRAISILFSPDPDQRRVMPVIWSWDNRFSGNPSSVEMGRRAVRLHIAGGLPLHGLWTPEKGWTRFNEGYWKIIVYR